MFMSVVINLLLTAETDVIRIYVTVCLYYSFNKIVEDKRRSYAINNKRKSEHNFEHKHIFPQIFQRNFKEEYCKRSYQSIQAWQ